MYYAKSTNGFYDEDIHGLSIPPDSVKISLEHWLWLVNGQSAGKVITPDEFGNPVLGNAPADTVRVPSNVTMRQARLALHAAGLLQSVETVIEDMEEPMKTAARIEWDYAGEVYRSSDFVKRVGVSLDLDDAKLDELFLAAAAL